MLRPDPGLGGTLGSRRNPELLHPAPQRVRVHAQNRRGASRTFNHAASALQHIEDVEAFDILQ
jgi:hypothetical protein